MNLKKLLVFNFALFAAIFLFIPSIHAATILAPITTPTVNATSATISWYTNLNSDTHVYFGTSIATLTPLTGNTISVGANTSITSGLIGYWPMDEGSGSSTADASGNGNPGTWIGLAGGTGGTHYATGKIGNYAGSFDGSTNYVDLGTGASLAPTSSITLAAWINSSNINTSFAGIISRSPGNAGVEYEMRMPNGGGYLDFEANLGGIEKGVIGKTHLQSNQWYFVAATYDGATESVYVNGVLDNSAAASGALHNNGDHTDIGRDYWYGGAFFPGLIDDARIYNRALSTSEIQALYNNGSVYQHGATLLGIAPHTTYYYYVTSAVGSSITIDNNGGSYYTFQTPNTTLNTLPFAYALASAGKTSAGVYTNDASETLIRTLWSGENDTAGTHNAVWDGNLDDGTQAPPGSYVIKMLYNNVQYNWEGVIGNTSAQFVNSGASSSIWRSLDSIHNMAFIPSTTKGIATMGYNEGQSDVLHFDTANPQSPFLFIPADQNELWIYVAADQNHVYLANTGVGWDTNNSTFVYAFNPDGSRATFTNGTSTKTSVGDVYSSAIDISQEINSPAAFDTPFVAKNQASGIAVQANGNILAVSHGGLNMIKLFDKTSGILLGAIPVTNPGEISFAPNGDLWVITGSSVESFANATLGATSTPASVIGGFINPLTLAVSPVNSNVLVADGGASQQIKAYSSAGVLQWTLGTAGGYSAANGPDITNTKFDFIAGYSFASGGILTSSNVPQPESFIAFQPDGSFWFGDGGDERALHFSPSQNYLNQISYITDSQRATVDPNNPTRVFALGWLEYQFNYGVPLNPGDPDPTLGGNGSWKLVKNWSAGMDLNYYGGFTDVTTVTSGSQTRTYAQVWQNPSGNNNYYALAELPASGPLRIVYSGATTPVSQIAWLAPNGDLRFGAFANGTETVSVEKLVGIDTSGNISWSSSTILTSAPAGNGDPKAGYPYWAWNPPWTTFPVAANNDVIIFNASQGTSTYPDYHLGGIPIGGAAYQFKTSKALNITTPDNQGDYTTLDGYGGHNGNQVWAVGNNVLWNYDGQNGSYSNQYAHYNDDGLFIGQFGSVAYNNGNIPQLAQTAVAGYSENYAESIMVQGTDGNLYAFAADESIHAGVHVWKISNLSSISEGSGIGTLGQAQPLAIAMPGVNAPPPAPDATPPTVSITSPAAGTVVAGTSTITVSASDNVGVTRVELYLDGALMLTDTSSPYNLSLGTVSLTNGAHTLTAKAYDAAGNVAASNPIAISVSNIIATPPASTNNTSGSGGGSDGGGGGTSVTGGGPVSSPGVSLVPSQTSGNPPLTISLTAFAGNIPQEAISYIFYCNAADGSTSTSTPFDTKLSGIFASSYTARNLCTYASSGAYMAKVVIQAGDASATEAEAKITVGGIGTGAASGITPAEPSSQITIPTSNNGLTALIAQLEAELQTLLAQAAEQGITVPGGNGSPTASSTAPASFSFTRNLTIGSVSMDVKELQHYLNTHGFSVDSSPTYAGSLGYETQHFGPSTKSALAQFQTSVGINPTGYFGPVTRAYVNGHE